ncbi:MAG: class II fructose-bisphosphate aldolase [Nitratireductor sp.]|nr:class II fructose-bisphosphate aldolase [Nitratireductor sp.]MCC0021028.1 class II fructose-bisphosphate aldolase [Nitratireductor sp.]
MSRANLRDVLLPARDGEYAVAGLVVLGWEDARTFVEAAEALGCPVILQAGPGFRRHMPIQVIAAMFNHLAENASVPVVAHLDHSTSKEECRIALDSGFTSVMFDGSRLELTQNIEKTSEVVELAREFSASTEGEIGFVGYAEGEPGNVTDPEEAGRFARQTGIDAMAVSVGNVHLQTEKQAIIDFDAIRAIESQTDIPLVLHGGSGISPETRRKLARETHVCKFNIGTELRMAFGSSLREVLAEDPVVFDRLTIMDRIAPAMREATREILRNISVA